MAVVLVNAIAPILPQLQGDTPEEMARWIRAATVVIEDGLKRTTEQLSQVSGFMRPSVVFDTGTSYTLTGDDEFTIIVITNASAITVNVPADATENLPIGYLTHVYQGGAGQVTLSPAGGVTINASSSVKTRAQYSALSLVKVAANTFHVIGDQE